MVGEFDVFLSYCSADETWVIRLKKALETAGFRVWRDKDCIRPGDLFLEEIAKGVRSSRCIAFVISRRSVESQWVREEYNRAISLAVNTGKRVIGLRLDDSAFPDFLEIRHAVDFRDTRNFEEAVRQLRWGITGSLPLPGAREDIPAAESAVGPEWGARPIAEITWLRGAIQRAEKSQRRLWRSRAAAIGLGIALGVAAAVAASGQGLWLPWLLGPGIPLAATMLAWGMTLAPMRANSLNLERWSSFRDALEGCAIDDHPHPGCREMRDRFWTEVQRRTAALTEVAAA